MNEMRLVIRDLNGDWSGKVARSAVQRLVAALSADPETFDELLMALKDFEASSGLGLESALSPGLELEPESAGIALIDLPARLLVFESCLSSPQHRGEVHFHNGRMETDILLPYRIDDEWLILSSMARWRGSAQQRRESRSIQKAKDYRKVLYGIPLMTFLVDEVIEAFSLETLTQDFTDADEAMASIHERWMLLPREEWSGISPREAIMSRFDFLDEDMSNRQVRWRLLDRPPSPLPVKSRALELAGWGESEFILYYDLVRHLLTTCWKWIAFEDAVSDTQAKEKFVQGLFEESKRWLTDPIEDFQGRSPQEIMDRERRRVPDVLKADDLDCQCELCRMMAQMPQPCFWHLDSSHMEDCIAFSMDDSDESDWCPYAGELQNDDPLDGSVIREEVGRCSPAEEGEIATREVVYSFQDRVEQALENRRLGMGPKGTASSGKWTIESNADEVRESLPSIVQLFSLGCRLGELIAELRRADGQKSLVDAIIEEWSRLREFSGATAPNPNDSLEKYLAKFHETLNVVLESNPNLRSLVVSLHDALNQFAFVEATESLSS